MWNAIVNVMTAMFNALHNLIVCIRGTRTYRRDFVCISNCFLQQ